MKKFLLETVGEPSSKDIEYEMLKKGDYDIDFLVFNKEDVAHLYCMKQNAEKLFGFSKDDLKLIPPRVHKESASRGLLFMLFLSLIVFVELKNAVGKEFSAG